MTCLLPSKQTPSRPYTQRLEADPVEDGREALDGMGCAGQDRVCKVGALGKVQDGWFGCDEVDVNTR